VGAATATFPLTGPGNDPRATMIRLPTSDGSFKALLTFQNGDALVVDVGASLSVTPKGRFFAEGGVTLGLRKSPTGEDTVLAISNVSTRPGFVAVEGTVAALLSNEAGGGVDAFVAQPVSPNIFDTSQLFVLAVGPEGQTLAVGQNGVVVGETRAPRQFGTLPFAERLPEVVQFANAPDGAIWALMERGILARWSKGALFEERNVGRRATNVLELPGFGHESVSILPSGEAIIGSAEEVIRVSIPVEETEPPVVVTTSNPARPGGGFGSGVPSLTVRMPGGTRENAAAVVMTNGDIYQMTLQPNAITFGEAPRPLGDVGLLPPGDRGIAVKAALDPKFNDAGAVAFWAAGVAPKDVRVVPAVVRCVVTRGVVTCAEPVEVTTLQSPRFDSTEAVASIQVLEDHLVVVYRSGVAAGLLTGIARDTYKEQGFDGQGFPAGLAAGGDLWVNGGNAVRTGDGCWVFGGRATQLVGAAVDEVPIALAVTHRNEAEAQIPQLLRINEQLFLGAGPAGALFGFAMEPQTDGRCFDPPSTLRSAPPALLGPKRSVTTLVAAGFLDGKTLVGDVTGRVWSLPLVCE
jgi:hypothetical protein